MKYLYEISTSRRIFILICMFFCVASLFSQSYITWNPVTMGTSITGSVGAINVTGTLTPGTTSFRIDSPAQSQANLIVNGANAFSTVGPYSVVCRDLVFTFNRPVIVTRFDMFDIDLGSWNDTFLFNGINFTNNPSPIFTNCLANLNGGTANTQVGPNAENASWFCSNSVTSFMIDYQSVRGLTHAYLAYSIEVIEAPSINPICVNDIAPSFPIIGNNIIGTWSPNNIDTSSVGSTVYTFTPAAGQSLQCPIEMTVLVENCCQSTLTSTTTISTMVQEERSDWIVSSDVVNFGDGIVGNGVVYHAGNFVELTEGFEAMFGSQFVAYPEGCSGNYTYKVNTSGQNNEPNLIEIKDKTVTKPPSIFNVFNENGILKVSIMNLYSNNLKIYSLSGKILYENNSDNQDFYNIDISSFEKGVYLITATIGNGDTFTEKFIID